MKNIFFSLLVACSFMYDATAQEATQLNLPKDAPVNVSIKDAKTGNYLNHEIVIFRSKINKREYQGLSDENGKFALRLPAGDKYEIFVLGFQDSTSYNVLDIPALKSNAFYKNPFNVNIEFEAPRSFVLENCTFESGKATLAAEAYTVLNELVDYLKRKDDEKIEIGGHTDDVGKAEANMILSKDRANTVMSYLVGQGIAPERLTAKGYGFTEPVTDNDTEEGRRTNRRTEVKILE